MSGTAHRAAGVDNERPPQAGIAARQRVARALLRATTPWRLLGVLLAGLLLGLASLQLLVGYADNADFERSMGFALAKPSGFHSMWERHAGGGSAERFNAVWHDRWVLRDTFVPLTEHRPWTTYKLWLRVQIAFASWLSGDARHYSVVLGSLLSRALLVLGVCWLIREVALGSTRATAAGSLAITVAVLLDASFAGLLNSFYEEQMAVLLLPLLAAATLALLRAPRLRWSLLVLGLCAALGGAKTAYCYLPALALPLVLACSRQRRHWPLLLGVFLLAQWVALQPLSTSQYVRTNAYHSLYFGALLGLPESRIDALEASGEDIERECIGVSAFMPGGEACRERTAVSHADTLALLLRHPDLGVLLAVRSLQFGAALRPDYLSQRMHDAADYAGLWPFNLVRLAFAAYGNALAMIVALLALLLLRRQRGSRAAPLLGGGIALAGFALSQYAVSLADGYYELVKHLLAANFALALATALLLPGLVLALADLRAGRAIPIPLPSADSPRA